MLTKDYLEKMEKYKNININERNEICEIHNKNIFVIALIVLNMYVKIV